MYKTLVLSDNFIICMSLESYLKKYGITNIYQSNSIKKISEYLVTNPVNKLYIDLGSSFIHDQELKDLLDQITSVQIIFLGNRKHFTIPLDLIDPKPIFISTPFEFHPFEHLEREPTY